MDGDVAPAPQKRSQRHAPRNVVTPDAAFTLLPSRTKRKKDRGGLLATSTSLPKLPGASAKPSPPHAKRSPKHTKALDYALFSWPGAESDARRAAVVSPAAMPSSLDFLDDDLSLRA